MVVAKPAKASNPGVLKSMRSNKNRDTKPELALRRAVHALGLRYRVSIRPLPTTRRTADLVFTKSKVSVFLDGCFWHGCPDHHTKSATNAAYWAEKVQTNMARDIETNHLLEEAGWNVIRIWEHEDPQVAAQLIADAVRSRARREVTAPIEKSDRSAEAGPVRRGRPLGSGAPTNDSSDPPSAT